MICSRPATCWRRNGHNCRRPVCRWVARPRGNPRQRTCRKNGKRPARPRSGAVEKDVCEELILAEELVFASFRQKGREHRLDEGKAAADICQLA